MGLTEEEIKEFQEIYLKVYGVKLDKDVAKTKAKRLIRFVALIINYDLENSITTDRNSNNCQKFDT